MLRRVTFELLLTGVGLILCVPRYEYAAGTLWGGFDYPRSNASAVYQLTLGFLLLVTLSAYTANLAAVLTVSSSGVLSSSTIEEAIFKKTPTCSYPNPLLQKLDNIYPTLSYQTLGLHSEIPAKLRVSQVGGCDGAIVPKITYDVQSLT